MGKILIVDDEKNIASSFKKILEDEGHDAFIACSAEEALKTVKSSIIDLVIMDIRMPGMSGLEAFAKFKEIDNKMPIIIMTAFGTTETAIEAMRLGAYEYIIKPFDIPQMKELIEKALEAMRLMKTEVTYKPEEETRGDRIIGSSNKMQQVYKLIGQVATSDVAILLRGESGTGKELISRAIYHYSKRKDKPFLIMNSAAIPDTLLESELFGCEKGAFTDAKERRIGKLEQCDGGTLFLDEIGDMPPSTQAKMLRILEDKSFERLGGNTTIKVNVRLITATNKNLEALIKESKFREDLYYRLNAITISIPPLRERKEDIAQLAQYFLAKYAKELSKEMTEISLEALRVLQNYNWPGNVRELENVIKKAVVLGHGKYLLPEYVAVSEVLLGGSEDLDGELRSILSKIIESKSRVLGDSLYEDVIQDIEKQLIIAILKKTKGNQTQAAKLLGISRPTLKDKIEKLGVTKDITISG
jgi:DNA-binding NtrC family response regulator